MFVFSSNSQKKKHVSFDTTLHTLQRLQGQNVVERHSLNIFQDVMKRLKHFWSARDPKVYIAPRCCHIFSSSGVAATPRPRILQKHNSSGSCTHDNSIASPHHAVGPCLRPEVPLEHTSEVLIRVPQRCSPVTVNASECQVLVFAVCMVKPQRLRIFTDIRLKQLIAQSNLDRCDLDP